MAGVEPARSLEHQHLKLARLPFLHMCKIQVSWCSPEESNLAPLRELLYRQPVPNRCTIGLQMLKHKNSKKQGDEGLGVAIGWFSCQGFTVCIPLTDSQPYDLVVETDDGLKKVQVKTTRNVRNGRCEVELRTKGGNKSGTGKTKQFDPKTVDLLFVLTHDGRKYLIPTNRLRGTSTIVLCEYYAEFLLE